MLSDEERARILAPRLRNLFSGSAPLDVRLELRLNALNGLVELRAELEFLHQRAHRPKPRLHIDRRGGASTVSTQALKPPSSACVFDEGGQSF